jgi:hypothetical protein
MPTMTARRRPPAPPKPKDLRVVVYQIRCPAVLWDRIERARWALQKESRHRLLIDAITDYLDRNEAAIARGASA